MYYRTINKKNKKNMWIDYYYIGYYIPPIFQHVNWFLYKIFSSPLVT